VDSTLVAVPIQPGSPSEIHTNERCAVGESGGIISYQVNALRLLRQSR
jgi:hypothetical protein